MTVYQNFIGIDMGKFSFVISVLSNNETKTYANTKQGIADFLKDYQDILPQSLCILENTGGYELDLLYTLHSLEIAAHRADTRKVKHFIRSYGVYVKTDALDAKALANYGFERHRNLDLFVPQEASLVILHQLLKRKHDLKAMIVAEKNRLKAPGSSIVKDTIADAITFLKEQIDKLEERINQLVEGHKELDGRRKILQTIPGIGKKVALELLILMPELGVLNRKKIAALGGLAPKANESGTFKGYRSVNKGRSGVKSILFLAAMAASRTKSNLGEFYRHLVAHGKKKMVALTALSRKILVIANAKLKELAYA